MKVYAKCKYKSIKSIGAILPLMFIRTPDFYTVLAIDHDLSPSSHLKE